MGELKKTIKVEVEIEFEYDPQNPNFAGMDEAYVDDIAKDLAFGRCKKYSDGIRLLHVCNREEDSWWLINGNKNI